MIVHALWICFILCEIEQFEIYKSIETQHCQPNGIIVWFDSNLMLYYYSPCHTVLSFLFPLLL
jgi:hypothetical protein